MKVGTTKVRLRKALWMLAFFLSAPLTSYAEVTEHTEEWLQYVYVYYGDSPVPIRFYEVKLYPTEVAKVKSYLSEAEWVSFEMQAKDGTYTSLSKLIGTKWPTGTVQEYQCESGFDHDEQYQLILSSIGRHVSTSWYGSCIAEEENKDLLNFSNEIGAHLDTKGIEEALLKRNIDASNQ